MVSHDLGVETFPNRAETQPKASAFFGTSIFTYNLQAVGCSLKPFGNLHAGIVFFLSQQPTDALRSFVKSCETSLSKNVLFDLT